MPKAKANAKAHAPHPGGGGDNGMNALAQVFQQMLDAMAPRQPVVPEARPITVRFEVA